MFAPESPLEVTKGVARLCQPKNDVAVRRDCVCKCATKVAKFVHRFQVMSPAITVAEAACCGEYDWHSTSVFFRLTVGLRPKRLAVSANRLNSSCASASACETSAH